MFEVIQLALICAGIAFLIGTTLEVREHSRMQRMFDRWDYGVATPAAKTRKPNAAALRLGNAIGRFVARWI